MRGKNIITTKLTAGVDTKPPKQQWRRPIKRKHDKKISNYLLVVAF
jgi:hypothetical protein